MSKVVTLTLNPSHESKYGEYTNLPVFDAHGNIIGYAGGEVTEHGHPCEFKVIGDEGFTSCVSSSEILRLRDENAELRKVAVSHYKDMLWSDNALEHIMAKKKLRELGIEVEE